MKLTEQSEEVSTLVAELNRLRKLIKPLEALGIIDTTGVRDTHVGESNYSQHAIQPWSIWIDYNMNPWDADIQKRLLRTKQTTDLTVNESRSLDYEKISHICQERIRQLSRLKEC